MTERQANGLTLAQAAVLKFIVRYQRENQTSPTRAEIAEMFGFRSANAAQDHLNALASKGFVRMTPRRSRGIFVLRHD